MRADLADNESVLLRAGTVRDEARDSAAKGAREFLMNEELTVSELNRLLAAGNEIRGD